MPFWASIVPAAIGAAGSLLAGRASNKANAAQNLISYGNQIDLDKQNYIRQKEFAQNQIQWRTEDATSAGVHPLFAMGAQTQSFQPGPGLTPGTTGSGTGDAIRGASRYAAKGAEDWLAAQIEHTKAKTAAIKANAQQDNVVPIIDALSQSVEKGRVQTHKLEYPEQNTSVISPMTQLRMGSQMVWLPVQEAQEIMENPASIGLATYIYHGNSNVNWTLLFKEYTGHAKKQSNKAQVKAGYKWVQENKARNDARRNKTKGWPTGGSYYKGAFPK